MGSIDKGRCGRRCMVGDNNDTCGEGQHDWIYEDEEVYCANCEAVAIDATIEPDGYVSDGDWCFQWHITVHKHTHQLDDMLKKARETKKDTSIQWDNLPPIDYNLNRPSDLAPKAKLPPRLVYEIECDNTDTIFQQFEEA